jgi:hypothetical protein
LAEGTEDSVVADFHHAARKHVLKESAEEFDTRQGDALELLRAVVSIVEAHHAIGGRFDAAVGDGDAENVASQIVQNLVAAPGMLGADDPVFLPHRRGSFGEQPHLLQSCAEFGPDDTSDRSGCGRSDTRRLSPGTVRTDRHDLPATVSGRRKYPAERVFARS